MGSQEYILNVTKGMERGIVISENVMNPDDYMYDTFLRAARAVNEIAQHAAKIRQKTENNEQLEIELYQFSQNLIAFAGKRGQGKTSAMISFAKMLSSKTDKTFILEDKKITLNDYSFTVLPPIDPTTLGNNQDMLTIILSRLFRKTEQLYKKQQGKRNYGFTELEKNEILSKIQRCLNHIGSLQKGFDHDGGKGMLQLHDVAESNDLKCELYELVERILRLEDASDAFNHKRFLVLQFDDTDFQVKRGYEILEDIRKYLTIPNVIILMATDMDLLRREVTQNYLTEFETSLKQKLIGTDVIEQLGAKYTAKTVSPMYTAYLPHLDELIREKINVKLAYKEGEKYLAPEEADDVDKFSLQATVLRYIYKKTGLVFAAHSGYLHNIIPTTLRGLEQLLSLLSSMEDPAAAEASTTEKLKETLTKRLHTLADNIRLFENYFVNDWIPAKLPENLRKEMEKITSVVSSELPYCIYRSVLGQLSKESSRHEEFSKRTTADYWDTAEILNYYVSENRNPESYKFAAAIRAYVTIQCNKTVNEKMLSTIKKHTADKNILFSVDECTVLDRFFYPPDEAVELIYKVNVDKEKKTPDTVLKYGYLLVTDSNAKYSRLAIYKTFVSDKVEKTGTLNSFACAEKTQKDLFGLQNQILLMLCNWDIQEKIYKEFILQTKKYKTIGSETPSFEEAIQHAFLRINCAEEFTQQGELNQNNNPMLSFGLLSNVTAACEEAYNQTMSSEGRSTVEEISRILQKAEEEEKAKASEQLKKIKLDIEEAYQSPAKLLDEDQKKKLTENVQSYCEITRELASIAEIITSLKISDDDIYNAYVSVIENALPDDDLKASWKALMMRGTNPNSNAPQ